ncbi:hypothetical protein V6N13_081777 [Hibiscus sabdariffa]
MASFNVFVVLSLHVLLLVSSSTIQSLHPLSVPHQAIEDEVKATSPLKKFSSLPHHSEQLTKAASVTSAIVKSNESKKFSNGKHKSALILGRKKIKSENWNASFNVFVLLSLHVLLLVSSSATRSLHPLSVPHQAIEDEVKATLPLKKFASLPHHSEQSTKAASVTSATVKMNESKEFTNGKNKSTLMQEGREVIKASMNRSNGNPFELKRLSPGGPNPHHH